MKQLVSGSLSQPVTASSSSATLITVPSSPTAIKYLQELFLCVHQMSDCPRSCPCSELPLDSSLWQAGCKTRLAHNSSKIQFILEGSLWVFEQPEEGVFGFITCVLNVGDVMWMGEGGSLCEGIFRAFPTCGAEIRGQGERGASLAGKALVGDDQGNEVPRI